MRRIIMGEGIRVYEGEHSDADLSAPSITRLKTFEASEMVACESCARANPPTRANCIYCGTSLPGGLTVNASPTVAASDDDAPRDAVFLWADQLRQASAETEGNLAQILEVRPEDLRAAVQAGGPLPLAAAAKAEQARLFQILDKMNLRPSILNAEQLAGGSVRKVRGLELHDDRLASLPLKSTESAAEWAEIVLCVVGRYFTSRIEVDEKRNRRKITTTDSRQFSADESVLDIHFNSGDRWRIRADNFDYSCLGGRKAATGFENFVRLINVLRECAVKAEFDESYARKRVLLANMWPLEEENRNSVAFARTRKFRQSTVVSNESQFNNYSRAAFVIKTQRTEFSK